MRTARPLAIHAGTCDDLTLDVGWELGNAVPINGDAEARGVTPERPVLRTSQTETITYDDILDTPYSIAAHQSTEEFGTIIACGEIGGAIDDGRLVVSIPTVDESGVAGIAIFEEDTAFLGIIGDDEINVTVYLLTGLEVAPVEEATPAPDDEATPPVDDATPVPADDEEANDENGVAETEVTVEMVDMDFNPNEFTIAADSDVTIELPNNGESVHNFVIDELDIHSGDVDPGDSTTITINAPAGEYYFYCDIPGHEEAGMFGTLIVEEEE